MGAALLFVSFLLPDVLHALQMEKHPALDDQDESVRIAVRALGDMRSGAHATAPAGSPSTCEFPCV